MSEKQPKTIGELSDQLLQIMHKYNSRDLKVLMTMDVNLRDGRCLQVEKAWGEVAVPISSSGTPPNRIQLLPIDFDHPANADPTL